MPGISVVCSPVHFINTHDQLPRYNNKTNTQSHAKNISNSNIVIEMPGFAWCKPKTARPRYTVKS